MEKFHRSFLVLCAGTCGEMIYTQKRLPKNYCATCRRRLSSKYYADHKQELLKYHKEYYRNSNMIHQTCGLGDGTLCASPVTKLCLFAGMCQEHCQCESFKKKSWAGWQRDRKNSHGRVAKT